MKQQHTRLRWIGLLTIVGGGIWIAAGSMLSLRPAGSPPHSYRATADMVPWLGLGLLLIGCSLGGWLNRYRRTFPRTGRLSIVLTISGAISYAIGSCVRAGFLSGEWEPFLPLGFIAVVLGLFLAGLASLRAVLLPRMVGALLIIGAASLLLFNDQFTPWMAVPFGGLAVMLGFRLITAQNLHKPTS